MQLTGGNEKVNDKSIVENKTVIGKNEQGNISASLSYISKFNISESSKILDVGCGYGSLIYNLQQRGYNKVYAIDINKNKILKGKSDYPEIAENLIFYNGEIIPYDDNYFDVILMFDVIEHIPKINNFLAEQVYRVLKNNGQFIFQTPNKNINVPWSILYNKSFSRWRQHHCSLQTKTTLLSLLWHSGFKDIVIERYNIITPHNLRKVRAKLGYMGVLMLHLFQRMPLALYPNLWGYGIKK